ncbi:MAG TPA: family 78 glycoside hydrolase catalytic domain [Galbitalea sp.]
MTTTFPGIRWHGHWIAPEQPPQPQTPITFGGEIPPHEFSRVHYRRSFDLDSVPASVPARLTADSRYVLWVNGVEVGRGPIRSQPRRLRYDEYDIAPFLTAGRNTVAVLVTYYGHANAFWQPAPASGGLGTDALLVFEAQLAGSLIVSDESWKVQRSKAWKAFPQADIDGVPVESLDARALPSAWTAAAFDDASWADAAIVSTTHIGGFARSQPPTDPFGAMLERGIGALAGPIVAASALTDSSTRERPGAWASEHPSDRVRQVLDALGDATASSLPVTAQLTGENLQHISVDFGRIVAGFVEVELDAPAGTSVELHYREYSFDSGVALMSAPRTSGQYITRGSDDTYSSLELNGLRYLHLVIHSEAEAEVTVRAIRVREFSYPWKGDAFFRSNDDEINALYTAGRRTVAMNSFDAFTDCPTREQRAWVGDGVVHQLVHLTTNEDWRLARNYITLGDSPRGDHMLPMTVVGEIEAGGATTIPDWALHWVHGVHNLLMFDGVTEQLLGVLPTVEKILRWYLPYVDETGTISDVPEWDLVDWSSVFSTGRSSILTSLWARGLAEYAEICEAVGNAASARWARGHWERARAGFEDFWDEARGTYVDHFVDGVKMPAASQAAGATAIVAGLVPSERLSRIIDVITDPSALVVRSWIGGNDGGYDLQKMADQGRGVQTIDWDVDTEIVLAEPFYSYVVHDAVAAAGRASDLVTLVRRWSQFLTDGYDTFGECWGWGTPVHGWSSTPTRDLVSYVLGVRPDEPGYAHARIAPAPGALTSLEGSVPTPHGAITVSLVDGVATVDSPVPFTFVDAAGRSHALPPGTHTLDFRR